MCMCMCMYVDVYVYVYMCINPPLCSFSLYTICTIHRATCSSCPSWATSLWTPPRDPSVRKLLLYCCLFILLYYCYVLLYYIHYTYTLYIVSRCLQEAHRYVHYYCIVVCSYYSTIVIMSFNTTLLLSSVLFSFVLLFYYPINTIRYGEIASRPVRRLREEQALRGFSDHWHVRPRYTEGHRYAAVLRR
jgi:hypothetical protein